MWTGMIIHTFEDTDINAYISLIRNQGFKSYLGKNYIMVGERIKKKYDTQALSKLIRRKFKGKSNEEIAESMKVSEQTVFNWKQGIQIPNEYNLKRLCETFDITEKEIEGCQI